MQLPFAGLFATAIFTLLSPDLIFLFVAASKARGTYQFSGKITVKAKEKTYSKLEIPYQAEVLEGYVVFH